MTSLRTLTLPVTLLCIAAIHAPLTHAQAEPVVTNANITFTTIDVPGAMNTGVLGINSTGQMVGYYYNGTGATSTGFLLSGGNFTFLNYPGADATEAIGINNSGLISGTAYFAQNTASLGFLYDGSTFTTIRLSNKEFTLVHGINNASDVVGGDGNGSANQAFVRIGTRFKNVTPPPGGWIVAVANGINNLGEIVGSTTGASTNGFVFKNGKFQTIAFPGSSITTAWGVNDAGIIVGNYENASGFAGFALMSGRRTSISYPGAMSTFAFGINNGGQIVGSYTLDGQTFHGFVTSPVTTLNPITESN